MKRQKRDRLTRAGWTVGSAQKFLGLTDAEAQLVAIRTQLAISLRDVREANDWSQAELAAALGSSQSRVAKMEAGDSSVSIDLLVRSLLATGVSRERIGSAFQGGRRRRSTTAGRR